MKVKKHFLHSFPILLLLYLCSGILLALTVKDASIEELSLESDLIVRANVRSIEYLWEDQTLKKINTIIQINVLEYLKGSGKNKLEISQMGGKIGDIEDIIIGTPNLNKNEEVLLFLVSEKNRLSIHSIALGCYKIKLNEKSQKVAYNDLSNVNLIDENSDALQQSADAKKIYLLNDMYKEIHSTLDQNQ
jgi:hypothetical protein